MAAIAGGVGILGFVALVGGGVFWARFEAAGLPTERAVAVMPRTELVVVGASVLVPLAAVITIATAIVWMVLGVRPAAKVIVEKSKPRSGKTKPPVTGPIAKPLTDRVGLIAAISCVATLGYAIHYSPDLTVVDAIVYVAVIAAAGVISAQAWTLLDGRTNFGVFVMMVAGVIVIVGLTITFLQVEERPMVRPAAVAFSGTNKALAGLFIAETDSEIYLAKVKRDPQNTDLGAEPTGQLIEIPRADVRAIAIGSNQSLPQALTRAPTLRREVKKFIPPTPTSGTASTR